MLQYVRLVDENSDYFAEAWQLYNRAFPRAERRSEPCHFAAMSGAPNFHCLALYDASGFVALIFYWVFRECVYVEHLAVEESRRGQGLGRAALAFAQQLGLPVILEIEPVVDEVTAGRLRFYESCGYHHLVCEHYQLPYHLGESPLRLDLLSYPTAASSDSIALFEQDFQNGPMRYREAFS